MNLKGRSECTAVYVRFLIYKQVPLAVPKQIHAFGAILA
jgi:hypothetical protein